MFTLYLFFILLETTTLFVVTQLYFGTWVPTKITGRSLSICLCQGRLRSSSHSALSPVQAVRKCTEEPDSQVPTPSAYPKCLSKCSKSRICPFGACQTKKNLPLHLVSTFMEKANSPISAFFASPAQKYLAMYKFHANIYHDLQTMLEVSF